MVARVTSSLTSASAWTLDFPQAVAPDMVTSTGISWSRSVSNPATQTHYTVSPSIDTLGKVKNDRWASAGLSKIAHMHESRIALRVAARSKLDFTSNLLSGGVSPKSSMADEFSEARQHCKVVPEGPSIPEKNDLPRAHAKTSPRPGGLLGLARDNAATVPTATPAGWDAATPLTLMSHRSSDTPKVTRWWL